MAIAPHDPLAPRSAPFAARPPQAAGGRAALSPVSAMNVTWVALHDAAGVVAGLAGLAADAPGAAERGFPAAMRDAGGWRRDLAAQGIDDLSAIMQSGLTALLAVHAAGASPQAPARALWDEFVAARAALLALVPAAGRERRPLA